MMDIDKLQGILDIPARFVDLVVQESSETKIVMRDGIIRDIITGETVGVGIRVLDRGWGFGSTADISEAFKIAEKARRMAKLGKDVEFNVKEPIEDNVYVAPKINPSQADLEEKKEILRKGAEVVSEFKEITSSTFVYADTTTRHRYLSSEGSDISSDYTRVSLFITAFAKRNGKLQVGSERIGGTGGLEYLDEIEESSKQAAEKAVRLLDARAAPSGNFRVVLDPKLTGVFIHEALGHALEADHVIRGESVLEGKLNKRIGSPLVTVYDDPTLEGSFGFYFYDSEGIRGERKIVVDGGILRGYLQSRETAARLGCEATGNARSQSYNYPPIPRMSNTYLASGDMSFEELIEDIDYGIYLKGSKGGEVDTIRGVFQFSAEEGFIIEKGELGCPIRDVALSGETLKILREIDGVGEDFDIHIGFCGKATQLVPVGDGGPHIRTFATVGGS
jgi:TldD protein